MSVRARRAAERLIITALVNRLRVCEYAYSHSDLLHPRPDDPLFIIGLPRSGTTLMSHLLAVDPLNRSLLKWEVADSIPPAKVGTLHLDSRCEKMRLYETAYLKRNPQAAVCHWEFADEPTECGSVHAQEFKSLLWAWRFPLPGYARWVVQCDILSAYRYHELLLRILHSTANSKWVLKAPAHALHLKQLLRMYPRARFVCLHRDPYRVVASACSAIRQAQGFHTLNPNAEYSPFITQEWSFLLGEHARRLVLGRQDIDDSHFCDIYYPDFIHDPIGHIQFLYKWLQRDLNPQTITSMSEWLRLHPQGMFGRHDYSWETTGLSVESLTNTFAPYIERFNVKREV